jgi:hypothetical protein
MPTGTKSTREFVASIRAFAIAHPDMSPMKIADTLGINMHHSNLYRIIYNRVFYDPLYTAPAHAGWKNRIKTVRIVNVKPNGKTRIEGLPDIIGEIRALKLAEPGLTIKAIHRRLRLAISLSTTANIVTNTTHHDPAYKPIKLYGNREIKGKRLASIYCPFTCPTCGSAYPEHGKEPFQTFNEAQKCCRKAEAR